MTYVAVARQTHEQYTSDRLPEVHVEDPYLHLRRKRCAKLDIPGPGLGSGPSAKKTVLQMQLDKVVERVINRLQFDAFYIMCDTQLQMSDAAG